MLESARKNAGRSRVTGGWNKSQRERFDRRAHDEHHASEAYGSTDRSAVYGSLAGELEEFVTLIRETPEYINYQTQKKKISENPELKKAADTLRMENFNIHMTASDEDVAEEVLKFAADNESLYRMPEIYDYLSAEASFCKMMQDVFDGILNGILEERL